MRINTIIFDMDGLMFDTENLYIDVFEDICNKNNYSFPRKYLLGMLGASDINLSKYEKEYPWIKEMFKLTNENLASYYDKRFAVAGSANKYGLKEIHDYLKKNGYKICIASSSRLVYIQKLVANCGFDFQADLILSSKGFCQSKPAPDIFLACTKKMGVKPENCLVLEDSKNGIRAAYNANMRRVWIPDQVPFNEEDMKYVDLQCENLKEVIDILEAM